MNNELPLTTPIAMIAGATGARCMTGLAAVARARAEHPDTLGSTPVGKRLDKHIAHATAALALGELIGDKLPSAGDRIAPGALAGRVIAGAVIGAAVAGMKGGDKRNAAIGGVVAALVGAHLSFQFRKSLSRVMPPVLAALVEDVAVLGLAAAGTTFLSPRREPVTVDSGTAPAAGARRQIATARILTESTESSRAERVPS